jgi:hypothetical protein
MSHEEQESRLACILDDKRRYHLLLLFLSGQADGVLGILQLGVLSARASMKISI